MTLAALQTPFDYATDPSGFLDQAIVLARAAQLAYGEDAAQIADELGLGAAKVTVFPQADGTPPSNTQGFWFREGDVAALVFRGTMNVGHWRSNFNVLPPSEANHPWGRAHPGFLGNFQAVIDTVMHPFAEAAQGADTVWISGHSLGGALAVLAAAWLRIEDKRWNPALLTFGQPMPGLGDFHQRFEDELPGRLTRIINQSDIVPRLPGFGGYAHCGRPRTITQKLALEAFGYGAQPAPTLVDSEPPPASQAELDAFLKQLEQPGALDGLEGADPAPSAAGRGGLKPEGMVTEHIRWTADHACARYIKNLEAIRQGRKPLAGLSMGKALPS